MKTVDQIPPMKPIGPGYVPGHDWSPGVPEHLVDELTGKPLGTTRPLHHGEVVVERGYPHLWAKKEDQQ